MIRVAGVPPAKQDEGPFPNENKNSQQASMPSGNEGALDFDLLHGLELDRALVKLELLCAWGFGLV